MATQEEIRAIYEANLKPKLEIFEEQRKGIVKKFVPVLIGGIVLVILLLILLSYLEEGWEWLIFISCFIILVGVFIYYLFLISPYKKEFKQNVVGRIVNFVDENLNYVPDKKITLSEFRASMLEKFWQSIDRWDGEDCVEGKLGKTAVKFSEVRAEHKTTTRNGQTKTNFKGLFFIFDFNKDFEGFTVVQPDYAERYFDWFGKMLQSFQGKIKPGELVKFADTEFEREFVVYSNNQITARYVLSTSLMRRLLTFRRKLKKAVYLSFVNGKLYIGIPVKKDLFEPTVFKTLLDFNLISEFFEYIQLGKDIVKELNLNTRIWSK